MGYADAIQLNGFRIACRAHGRDLLEFIGPGTDEAFDTYVGNRPEDPITFTVSGLVGGDGGGVLSVVADANERIYTVAKADFVDTGKQWTPAEGWRVVDPVTNETWWVKGDGVDEGMNGMLFRVVCTKKR